MEHWMDNELKVFPLRIWLIGYAVRAVIVLQAVALGDAVNLGVVRAVPVHGGGGCIDGTGGSVCESAGPNRTWNRADSFAHLLLPAGRCYRTCHDGASLGTRGSLLGAEGLFFASRNPTPCTRRVGGHTSKVTANEQPGRPHSELP
ncbi:hypothetical protein B0T10DRAFT_456283 [Thelonectria olida]|uniref:Uncharacterized protein n=1 Tax=Thelonectria olida TaxID=1576542 RepID=A0A9P8WDA0_9HYPO|nr:hypothetical protein B0T10DRAFT_456283 [Thelonectria olida]